jgi:hypothetical protein
MGARKLFAGARNFLHPPHFYGKIKSTRSPRVIFLPNTADW